MAANESIQIQGLNKLIRDLRKYEPDAAKALRESSLASAKFVASSANGYVPRLSGALAGTIRAGATARSGVVRAGRAKVPYAPPIHWGWGRRHIAPQPFLTKALGYNAERIMDDWLKSLEKLNEQLGER